MRLLISSKNTLIPNGLKHTLLASRHDVVTHYYHSPEQLISKVILERSEVAILDKATATMFTYPEIKALRDRLPHLKLILLSTIDYLEFMHQCYIGGVDAYLTYDCSTEEIEEALDSIGEQRQFFCQKILTALAPLFLSNRESTIDVLTEREKEIAHLIAEGNTNKQIGELLFISPHTVHSHRKSLMKKLGVSSAREIAIYLLSH
ncbi:MAG TPA: response regulator transcription factor [Fluviicola sp.]|nr:response regulator transcription factor [Fluviicola sp.]